MDLEGWLAFVLLPLPMFGGELPVAIETALPHARRMLLLLGMIHTGDARGDTITTLETSRRELRRIVGLADLDPKPEEIIRRQVDRIRTDTNDA